MSEPENKSIFSTKHSLLERVRNPEDKESWKEFVSYYEQYIYNVLRTTKIPSADASELCQDVIIQLWKKLPEFAYNRDKGKFRHWLSVVIRNQTKMYFRSKSRSQRVVESTEDEILLNNEDPDTSQDIDKIIADEWEKYICNLAWKSVKNRFKEPVQNVFVLHNEGKSNKEISEICKIQEGTVRTYIARIRSYLVDEIQIYKRELL